jgi:hypothetical protein
MHIKSLFALMSLLLLFSQSYAVFAISVFQWVDAEGVTHFSEETPTNNSPTKQLSHYELAENYPQGRAPEEDYFSIVNQWKRANDERESRMKLKQANKQSSHFVPQQAQPLATYQPPQRYYNGLLPSPYLYNRGRAHHRGRFVHQPKTMEQVPAVTPGYAGNVAPSN